MYVLTFTLLGFLSVEADTFLRSLRNFIPTRRDCDGHEDASNPSISSTRISTCGQPYLKNMQQKCIIHGDCWSSNFMFTDHGKSAKVIDFQFAKFGLPAEDIAVLLCTSVDPDVRRGVKGDNSVNGAGVSQYLSIYNEQVDAYICEYPAVEEFWKVQ